MDFFPNLEIKKNILHYGNYFVNSMIKKSVFYKYKVLHDFAEPQDLTGKITDRYTSGIVLNSLQCCTFDDWRPSGIVLFCD